MIKIDVEKINNWDIIKEKHSKWYKINILPNIRRVYNELYEKDLDVFIEKDFIKKYLNILEEIIKKDETFVIEEKEKFDENLFDKDFIKNLKKESKWYKEKILPNICKAYNELSNEYKKDSIKSYLDILEKIKEEKKDFIVEKKQ